jgi:glycosyltransferase involved in cell wall biosynthesis
MAGNMFVNNLSDNGPLVSVIITTHNRLDLLKKAIDSVRNQSYKNFELIVVDDASIYGTKEYCEGQDFDYIYIPQEESKGGNHARNIGIKSAKGKYCAFLDDDDRWKESYLEKMVGLIEEKGCGMVYSGVTYEQYNGDDVQYEDIVHGFDGDLSTIVLYCAFASTSCMMVNKELLNHIGMFDENLTAWQDYELVLRIAQETSIYVVREPLIYYRIVANDRICVSSNYSNWKQSYRYIYRKHKQLFHRLNDYERLLQKKFVWTHAMHKSSTSGKRFANSLYRRLLRRNTPVFIKKIVPLLFL